MSNVFAIGMLLLCFAAPALVPPAQAGEEKPAINSVKALSPEKLQDYIKTRKALARNAVSQELKSTLTPLEQDWGVKLYGIRWTASGYMLEMRLRVLDRHRAFPLLKRNIKRYLIVEKDGSVLEIPFTQKLGALRSTVRTSNMVRDDTNYVALFANPGQHVRPGDKVTLVIGNFIAENIVVQ